MRNLPDRSFAYILRISSGAPTITLLVACWVAAEAVYPHGGFDLPSRRVSFTLTNGFGYPHEGFGLPSRRICRRARQGRFQVHRAVC